MFTSKWLITFGFLQNTQWRIMRDQGDQSVTDDDVLKWKHHMISWVNLSEDLVQNQTPGSLSLTT